MRRLVRALGALLALVAGVAGAPFALLAWGSSPHGDWSMLLRPADGTLLMVVLTTTGWLAWAAFSASTAAELLRIVTSNRLRVRLPRLGGLQALSAGLLFAVLSLVTTPQASAAQAAPAVSLASSSPIAPAVPGTTGAADVGIAPSGADGAPGAAGASTLVGSGGSAPTLAVAQQAAVGSVARTAQAGAPLQYVVAAGDDLWTVADRLLGDGSRWRDLVAANPEVLADPTGQLVPGVRLQIPGQTGSEAGSRRVVVKPGDTLSGLAKKHLGDPDRWPRIEQANPDLIHDPDHIEVGWRVVIPTTSQNVRSETKVSGRSESGKGARAGSSVPEGGAPGANSSTSTAPQERRSDHEGSTASGPGAEVAAPEAGVQQQAVKPGEGAPGVQVRGGDAASGVQVPGGDAASEVTVPSDDAASEVTVPSGDAASEVQVPESEGPASAVPSPAPLQEAAPDSGDEDHTRSLLGGLGVLCAAGVVGGLETRRVLQLRSRPVGRRIAHPSASAASVRTALGRRQAPDRLVVLDAALRAVGQHCHSTGKVLPDLREVVVTGEWITLVWCEAFGPPPAGFGGSVQAWTVALPAGEGLLPALVAARDHPCPYPALVTLGQTDDGASLMVDAERSRLLGVASDAADLQQGALTAMAIELGCAPWAGELHVTVVGPDAGLTGAAGGDRLRHVRDVGAALTEVQSLLDQRRAALGDDDLRALRVDPQRCDAVAPRVYIITEPLDPATQEHLDCWLAGVPAAIAVIVATQSDSPAQWVVGGDPSYPRGRHVPTSRDLDAQVVPSATRDAIAELFSAADDHSTTPAPWWSGNSRAANVLPLHPRTVTSEETVDIVRLRHLAPAHPQLLLIGPIDAIGTAGPEPTRSRQQLVEMCGWLLENPGLTSSAMASALLVAEGTRRSNMSRLRTWLGADPDGRAYLPDAYSGRIRLHPDVSSDWNRVQLLLGPGVDRVGDSALIAVMDLVRGAPLADAAPGQWHWAEEMRTDISSAIRDTGLVLVDHALARGEVDLARWAAARALLAAPEDELLMCARIRTEHRAGNRAEVERLVARLTQQARTLGVDLMPETVLLCQEVIEGRPRARWA